MTRQNLSLPYFLLTGAVVIAILASITLFRSQINYVQETRTAISQHESQLAEKQAFVASIDRKISELATHQSTEQELSMILPEDGAYQDMLRIIERLATESQVTVTGITNKTNQSLAQARAVKVKGQGVSLPDHVMPLGADLSISGDYQRIRQFLGSLENQVRLVSVPKLDISASESAEVPITANLSVNFYRYLENQE